MKTLHIPMDNVDFENLEKEKKESKAKNWRDFIFDLLKFKKENGNGK